VTIRNRDKARLLRCSKQAARWGGVGTQGNGGLQMTSESMVQDRRSTLLAGVIGAVLASYASGAAALEFNFDDGSRLNWNTTLSVGSSWRSEDPSRLLYTMADGALIGKYSGPYIPGTRVAKGNGLAGNDAGGDSNLNYAQYDRFSTPFKILSDVEYKKGKFGGLVRFKAWYDQATSDEKVRGVDYAFYRDLLAGVYDAEVNRGLTAEEQARGYAGLYERSLVKA
jgi:hypothetical protein